MIITCAECAAEHVAKAGNGDLNAVVMDFTAWYLSHWITNHWETLTALRLKYDNGGTI